MIARRGDRPGGTGVQAARTAHLPGAGMRAERFLQPHVKRFLEGPDQLARLERQPRHGQRITRIGPQIAFALVPGLHEGRAARQVDQDIA